MSERQWAFTPAGANYPPYLNVTELVDGSFLVTVRSPINDDGSCGRTSMIAMSGEDFMRWLREISDYLIQ